MTTRTLFRFASCALLLTAGGLLTGCSRDSTVTATEEAKFKNPSKEMPAEAKEYMAKHGGGGAPASAPTGAPH